MHSICVNISSSIDSIKWAFGFLWIIFVLHVIVSYALDLFLFDLTIFLSLYLSISLFLSPFSLFSSSPTFVIHVMKPTENNGMQWWRSYYSRGSTVHSSTPRNQCLNSTSLLHHSNLCRLWTQRFWIEWTEKFSFVFEHISPWAKTKTHLRLCVWWAQHSHLVRSMCMVKMPSCFTS